MLAAALQDFRHAVRLLGRQRGFTVTAILTLGLSTGAAAAILSVIDAALLHPLPYPHPEQLVKVNLSEDVNGERHTGLSPSLDDVRAWNTPGSALTTVAVERTVFPDRVIDAGTPERVKSMNVTEQYFPLFGVSPFAGRLFTAGDTTTGAPGAILLSYEFWRSRFGDDRSAVNRVVHFDGDTVIIVGILPPAFGQAIPVWRALQMPANFQSRRGAGWSVIGRLMPGVDRPAAAARLAAAVAGITPIADVRIRSLLDETRADYRTAVTIIASAVALILLIACVNVAGLILARGASRQEELAVRSALGASRLRLFGQLLIESLTLSVAGGLAGLGLAALTIRGIVANIPIDLPDDAPARLNGFVLAATFGVALINGVLFGVVPALRGSRSSSRRALARAGRQHAAGLSRRGGQILIAIEIALTVVMVTGAGLMVRSFVRLMTVDMGIDPSSYLTLRVQPLDQQGTTAARYYPALVERIRQLPGVEWVGAADYAPLADGFSVTAARRPDGELQQMIQKIVVLPGYFEAAGLQARAGRTFKDSDHGDQETIVINEKTAHLLFGDQAAVGRAVEIAGRTFVTRTVIGVVPDARLQDPRVSVYPAIYQLLQPSADPVTLPRQMTVVVRPRPDARNLAEPLRRAAESIGPPVVIDGIRRGSDWLSERVLVPRQRLVLLSLLGVLGLALAVVGVLGTTSYAVSRRTQEIGIRLALGARPQRIVRSVLLESAGPIAIGIAAGTGASMLATTVIRSFLYETSPTDSLTFASVAVLLLLTGCVAAWIPARRAARVDPVAALRSE